MIKQMGNHRDDEMSNLINHRLSESQHRTGDCQCVSSAMNDPGSGLPDKASMPDRINNFRDRCANLEAIDEGSTDASQDTARWPSHTTRTSRLKPDAEQPVERPLGHRSVASNDIYVNYNCKNNQIDKQNVNHRSNSAYVHCSPTMVKRQTSNSSSFQLLTLLTFTLTLTLITAQTSVTFEKLTNRDYAGFTYYTIRNVSLYECLGK